MLKRKRIFQGRAGEAVESIKSKLKGGNLNPLSENNIILRSGQELGNMVENNGKFTHYINRRIAGDPPALAAMSTKGALFDYTALTPFEKQYMRFIYPFWAWSKNNIPLQIKQIIQHPGRFSKIPQVKQEIEAQMGTQNTNLNWLPQWQKDSFPIILDKMSEANRFKLFLLAGWLPAADLGKLFDLPTLSTSSLEPYSKEALQQISNKDFFLQRSIEDYPGDVSSMLGVEMPARLKHVLKMFRIVNWLDQLNPGSIFGTYKGKPSWAKATRETIDLQPGDKALSSFAGLRIYPYDITQAQAYAKAKQGREISLLNVARKKAQRLGNMNKVRELSIKINKIKQNNYNQTQQ